MSTTVPGRLESIIQWLSFPSSIQDRNGNRDRSSLPCLPSRCKGTGSPYMKAEHIEILVKHRLRQATDALKDARILLDNQGSPQSIVKAVEPISMKQAEGILGEAVVFVNA